MYQQSFAANRLIRVYLRDSGKPRKLGVGKRNGNKIWRERPLFLVLVFVAVAEIDTCFMCVI